VCHCLRALLSQLAHRRELSGAFSYSIISSSLRLFVSLILGLVLPVAERGCVFQPWRASRILVFSLFCHDTCSLRLYTMTFVIFPCQTKHKVRWIKQRYTGINTRIEPDARCQRMSLAKVHIRGRPMLTIWLRSSVQIWRGSERRTSDGLRNN
jgi:hypothetical protein